MTCPLCNKNTVVTYTVKDTDAIYRKRVCKSCKYAFYTTELEHETSHDDFLELYNEIRKKGGQI